MKHADIQSSLHEDLFYELIQESSKNFTKEGSFLLASWIDTLLGPLLAISDEKVLYILEFANEKRIEKAVKNICAKTKSAIIFSNSNPITSIKKELKEYFSGELKNFTTPTCPIGTDFQMRVWLELLSIPYGKTKSYAAEAASIGMPTATRAVANANGANHLAIVIPCHRIINSDGKLGGYGGGIAHKKWLIEHEMRNY